MCSFEVVLDVEIELDLEAEAVRPQHACRFTGLKVA